jgi:Domain of unknown function (DUF5916)
MPFRWCFCGGAALASVFISGPAEAQSTLAGDRIAMTRAAGPIAIDGDLSDAGWQGAAKIDRWYEVNPGDNVEPKVRNVGYLSYDDKYFYAAFDFEDPDPSGMRAPFADRDNLGNGYTDYGGIILDASNSGHSATFFVVTPRNIQYDAITDDTSGEDSSPDFFWASATRINAHGWTVEMRIPFTSLRYRNVDPQTWGILLYRNYPRARRYQYFSARLPRGSICFICRSNPLTGLEHLPGGGHLIAAPYVSANEVARPRGAIGTPLVSEPVKPHAGLDVKYSPNADTVLDFTLNPDFSQIESDTAQITANERFALFVPEKRPFFLEGVDLLQTPIQAVYTRTILSPDWGGRITGKQGGIRYTLLVANDKGGGSVILPGPNGSDLATQDFKSTDVVARVKREIGLSSVGMLFTDREAQGGADAAGSGYNRVVGPDIQWRPSGSDAITGQFLYSKTRTPNRPDLTNEWTGGRLGGHAASIDWLHTTTHADWFGVYRDLSDDFRADNGFVPQVGIRLVNGGGGWTVRPTGFFSRVRIFVSADHQTERTGALVSREIMPGIGMDTRWNGFMQFRLIDDRVRAGEQLIRRTQFGYVLRFSPSRRVTQLSVDGVSGQEIDFANARPGRGTTVNVTVSLNPTDHLELTAMLNRRGLNVDEASGADSRLLTSRVSRLHATYTFTARLFVRVIAQSTATTRDPRLFLATVSGKDSDFSGSALLAYKLNWQSVLFVGYGDNRELVGSRSLTPSERQFFVKMSYALQH